VSQAPDKHKLLRIWPLVAVLGLVFAVACGSDDGEQMTPVATPTIQIAQGTPYDGPVCGEGSGSRLDAVERRIQANASSQQRQFRAQPEMAIDTERAYVAHMVTSKGKLTIELAARDVPTTVNNFVFLSCSGFYDGLTFHRVVISPQPFVIQGGDPRGDGTGGPGYLFHDEFHPNWRHETGVISMANSGPNTNGSQFFITLAPAPHLDDAHSVFGKVTEGMEVVRAIRQGDRIERVDIEER
jgi:peptidyl-prolyl cis-trans isomerase B (cyclophilin B)